MLVSAYTTKTCSSLSTNVLHANNGWSYEFSSKQEKKRVVKALKRGFDLAEALKCWDKEVFDSMWQEKILDHIPVQEPAEMLNEASKALFEYIQDNHGLDKPIVILGRDAWPLVPILRERYGLKKVHYFLFSRLQIGDKGTEVQWLKEIPKGALVVDTGYKGSIFDAIKVFDPSIKGVLISSSGKYPQLELNIPHKEVVQGIEKMPKIIGRCVALNSEGKARCPQDTRDKDEVGTLFASEVILWNKGLLRELNLSVKWASFTGITARSRVPGGKLKLAYLKAAKSRKVHRVSDSFTSRWEVRQLIKSKCPFIEKFIKNFLVPAGIYPSCIEVSADTSKIYIQVSNDYNTYLLSYKEKTDSWLFKKNGITIFDMGSDFFIVERTWPGGYFAPNYIYDDDDVYNEEDEYDVYDYEDDEDEV